MQNKGGVLMRKSFVLLVAIFFVILISTLGALSLALSASSVKNTTSAYLREQAELLAISATEHAILALQAHDFNKNCLEEINSAFPSDSNNKKMFDIKVKIYYIANDLNCDKHSKYNGDTNLTRINIKNANVTNDEKKDPNFMRNTYKMAIIDTIVTSADGVVTEPIRFHRRTTQSLNYVTKIF